MDESGISFTLIHQNPRGVHAVAICVEAAGHFRVTCYGRVPPGSIHPPVLGAVDVAIAENLAAALGNLTGIAALQHRHL
jgi:hypothetical protein